MKARHLTAGDNFKMIVKGRVIAARPVADGKRIKVTDELDNERRLEFLDDGSVLRFICTPGRELTAWKPRGRRGGSTEDPGPVPTPRVPEDVSA